MVSFDLEYEVSALMRDMGVPAHLMGYQYLREAIGLVVTNAKSFSSVTRILYPEVAEKFGTSPQKVERSIRNAIENTWEKGNSNGLESIFSSLTRKRGDKPTNSEFIAVMAERIKQKIDHRIR